MIENIISSLRGIWSHKLRSFLTMLGVIIGIASIIAIVSIVEGTNQKLEKSLIGAGNNVTTVALMQEGWTYDFGMGIPDGVPMIEEPVMERIRSIEGVEAATEYNSRQGWHSVFYQNKTINQCTVYGITDTYLDTLQYRVVNGRGILDEEFEAGAKVAVINEGIVDALFTGVDPIGEVIEIQQEPFVIVGVIRESNKADVEYETINDYYTYAYEANMGQVLVPEKTWPILYSFDEPQTVGVRVANTRDMAVLGGKAADILNEQVTSGSVSYGSANSSDYADSMKTLTNAIQLMLVSIASLSLLVGGIGVMNIMLVSVTERTSEIGLKKALGAKRRTILAQFLTEAAVLTSVGGLIGVLAGIGLARIIAEVADLEFGISVPWILIAVGFSIGIGVLFGAMPASRAAKLNPIDALRRE